MGSLPLWPGDSLTILYDGFVNRLQEFQFPSFLLLKLRGFDFYPGGTHLPLTMPAFCWTHTRADLSTATRVLSGSPAIRKLSTDLLCASLRTSRRFLPESLDEHQLAARILVLRGAIPEICRQLGVDLPRVALTGRPNRLPKGIELIYRIRRIARDQILLITEINVLDMLGCHLPHARTNRGIRP